MINGQLGELGQTAIRFTPEFDLDGAVIALGTEGGIQPVVSDQVIVSGSLSELDIEAWRIAFQDSQDVMMR